MDDSAAGGRTTGQLEAIEVAPPIRRRILLGELEQDARYRIRRSRGSEDWLLLHTVDGVGIIRGAEGGHVTIAAGEAVLIAPDAFQDYGTDPRSGRWHLLYAHVLAPPSWQVLLDWPQVLPGVGRITVGAALDARVRRHLRSAARASRMGVGHPELFALNGVEAALLWYDARNPRRRQIDERILRVLEHIDAHLAEDLDVATLAEVAHLSPSRLSHLFREQLETTVLRHVEAQRMELAARLLEMTREPVAEIARRVGFADPLYFSLRFRRVRGMPPTAYRSELRQEGA